MSNIKIFENGALGKVRVVIKDGEPNFIAKDVCEILGLSNVSRATARIKDRWVTKSKVPHPQSDTKMIVVNSVKEPGLYKLAMRSNKDEAEQFTDWIAEDVLPSIRKHGVYATEKTIDRMINNPDFGIELLSQLKQERQEKQKLIGKINQLKPKADYTDKILKNKGLVTITQIAKDYGMSGRAMNELLHDLGVQYKQSGQWMLYADHQGEGYTHSQTINITRADGTPDVVMNTKWTQKGRLFLYELLKEEGVLPTIEREVN
jgi:hypothetical protein